MRWLLVILLLIPLNANSQSVADFPRIASVSTVTLVGPFLFFDLEHVIPQPPFRQWWAEMEACTGIRKPFDGVEWYVADLIFNAVNRFTAWGIYYASPPEIVLVRDQTLPQLEDTVKHETLHHLVENTDHEEEAFVRCLAEPPEHQWKPS